MVKEISVFKRKQIELEELDKLYELVQTDIKYLLTEYRKTEELEQKRKWNSETHEYDLLWEDDEQTIPLMENVWRDVEITEDELSDESKLKLDVYRSLIKKLEKML